MAKKAAVAAPQQPAGEPTGVATVLEAAAYLKVSQGTVYNLMRDGKLAFSRIGRSRRIPWESIRKACGTHHPAA